MNYVACAFTGHRPSKLPWKDDETSPSFLRFRETVESTVDDLAKRVAPSTFSAVWRRGRTRFARKSFSRTMFEQLHTRMKYIEEEHMNHYDAELNYGWVRSHDDYEIHHAFELTDPDEATDDEMGKKLAATLETTPEDDDYNWNVKRVLMPDTLVKKI